LFSSFLIEYHAALDDDIAQRAKYIIILPDQQMPRCNSNKYLRTTT